MIFIDSVVKWFLFSSVYKRAGACDLIIKLTKHVLVTLLPEKVKYIILRYRFGNAMGDNREETYLQNPLYKMAIQKIMMQVHRKFFSNISLL